MRQIKSLFLSVLFFVCFSVLGIAIGFGIGNMAVTLSNEGLFTSWKKLDNSQSFESIVDISFQTIWAQTADGKLYSWKFYCDRDSDCNRWIETTEIPGETNFSFEQQVKKSNSCKIPSFQFFREVPGMPVECAQVEFYGMENQTNASFVLLDDGTIWLWKFTSSMIVNLIIPAIFSLVGFMLGIMLFSFFILRRRSNKTQSVEASIS